MRATKEVHPFMLRQPLQSGGFELCEAGCKVAFYGEGGKTEFTFYLGEAEVIHHLLSVGPGFDVEETYRVSRFSGSWSRHGRYSPVYWSYLCVVPSSISSSVALFVTAWLPAFT